MKVLVDTCIWSLALRRKTVVEDPYARELAALVKEFRVQMIGPIRQEILSGVTSKKTYELLKTNLAAFPDLLLKTEVFEQAAWIYNQNRKKGIQGSNTDFLLCAVSFLYEMPIFTTDKDFLLFQTHSFIRLHSPRPFLPDGIHTRG
jgi:predicted nucleic acid-binding protein